MITVRDSRGVRDSIRAVCLTPPSTAIDIQQTLICEEVDAVSTWKHAEPGKPTSNANVLAI